MTSLAKSSEGVVNGDNSTSPLFTFAKPSSASPRPEDPLMRPRDLADKTSIAPASTTFTLPIAEARSKAREIISQVSLDGIIPVIENWHLVSEDQVEFTVRNLLSKD